MNDQNRSLPAEIQNPQIKRQLWGPWSTLGFGLIVGIVYLISGVFVTVIFAIVKAFSAPTTDPLQFLETLVSDGLLISLSIIVSTIVCGGLLLVIIKVRRGAPIAEYLSLRRITKKTILILLGITAGIIVLSDILTFILGKPLNPDFMVNAYNTSLACIIMDSRGYFCSNI